MLDPQHRALLECAWHALEHAGHGHVGRRLRVGVFAGVANSAYYHAHVSPSLAAGDSALAYQALIGGERDFAATRIAYVLDCDGPAVNVQTACSTSLVATHLACQALIAGECDLALAGGAAVRLPQRVGLPPRGRDDPVARRALPRLRRRRERHGDRQRGGHRGPAPPRRRARRRRHRARGDPRLRREQRRRAQGGLHRTGGRGTGGCRAGGAHARRRAGRVAGLRRGARHGDRHGRSHRGGRARRGVPAHDERARLLRAGVGQDATSVTSTSPRAWSG